MTMIRDSGADGVLVGVPFYFPSTADNAVRFYHDIAELFPTRTDWWVAKIERNMQRDQEVNARLATAGWTVVRIWESDVLSDPEHAADMVMQAIRG